MNMSEIRITETPIINAGLNVIGDPSPLMPNSIDKRRNKRKSPKTENELCRLQHSEQLEAEGAERLAKIVTDLEMRRLLSPSNQEAVLADAMTALEAFIRNNEISKE